MSHTFALVCAIIGCVYPRPIVIIENNIDVELSDQVLEIANQSPQEIRVVIDSEGGIADAAEAIASTFMYLRSQGVSVRCLVTGKALSAAFWILQSCSKRMATSNAVLMIHEPYIMSFGTGIFTVNDLQEMHDDLLHTSDTIASLVASRLGMSVQNFHKKIEKEDWTMTAIEGMINHALDSIYIGSKERFMR